VEVDVSGPILCGLGEVTGGADGGRAGGGVGGSDTRCPLVVVTSEGEVLVYHVELTASDPGPRFPLSPLLSPLSSLLSPQTLNPKPRTLAQPPAAGSLCPNPNPKPKP